MMKDVKVSADLLKHLLADQTILMMKVRNYHWNVEGKGFIAIHRYLDEVYAKLSDDMDETAERIRMIGEAIAVSVVDFSKLAHIQEDPRIWVSADEMLKNLVADFESLVVEILKIKEQLEENNDVISANLMDGYLENYTTFAWFLKSSLG